MPNGLRLWWSSRAEEEAYFIFGEVFDDRTYARMGIRVQDGDTVWDVGEILSGSDRPTEEAWPLTLGCKKLYIA